MRFLYFAINKDEDKNTYSKGEAFKRKFFNYLTVFFNISNNISYTDNLYRSFGFKVGNDHRKFRNYTNTKLKEAQKLNWNGHFPLLCNMDGEFSFAC